MVLFKKTTVIYDILTNVIKIKMCNILMENVGYISQIYIVRRCQLCSAAKVKYGSSCMFVIMVAKKTLDISYIFAYDFYIFGL